MGSGFQIKFHSICFNNISRLGESILIIKNDNIHNSYSGKNIEILRIITPAYEESMLCTRREETASLLFVLHYNIPVGPELYSKCRLSPLSSESSASCVTYCFLIL